MTEREEFCLFVDAHSRSLLRLARLLCGEWFTAEDLVQSTLLTVWRQWPTVAASDVPVAYVRRILLHDFLRTRRRLWTGEIPTLTLPDHADGSDDHAATETHMLVEQALKRLPARQRAVIVLRFFADLTEAEAAATLGVSVGAVKSHTAKAMSTLRSSRGLAAMLTEELCP